MTAFKQFEGLIQAGQSHTWFVWGFPKNVFVEWMVRPLSGSDPDRNGRRTRVSVEKVVVQAEPDGTYTHFITVRADAVARVPAGVNFTVLFTFELFQNQTPL